MPNINTYEEFLSTLAKEESQGHGDYRAEKGAFIGRYQMGPKALQDAGYKDASGNWTGKNGINNKEDFKNSVTAQEDAIRLFHQRIERFIALNNLEQFLGKIIAGVKVTQYGMLGGGHLVGMGDLRNFLKSDGSIIPADDNLTPITSYMRRLAGGRDSAQDPFEGKEVPIPQEKPEDVGEPFTSQLTPEDEEELVTMVKDWYVGLWCARFEQWVEGIGKPMETITVDINDEQ